MIKTIIGMSAEKAMGRIKDFKTSLSQQEGSWSSKLLCRFSIVFAIFFSAFIVVAAALSFSGINDMGSSMKYMVLQYNRIENLYKSILALRIARQHYYCEEPSSSPIISDRIDFYYSLV